MEAFDFVAGVCGTCNNAPIILVLAGPLKRWSKGVENLEPWHFKRAQQVLKNKKIQLFF